ncbi:hypothetical protein QOZ80_2AG0151590 [Eleusine coracana subsp. coracana]|nr:hypothetical protein QOZ80_2AG0151590 [Eleusine coracana subsp. coracana]
MADAPPGTPRRLARSSSSLGVWWKLGDAAAGVDASPEVERRLRGIAEEEAAVRARMERRHAAAPAIRRKVALTSMSLELVTFLYGLWRTRRSIASSRVLKLLLFPAALAIPALSAILLVAFTRFRKILDARDEQKLQRLAAERKANLGSFRGSYHNLQKLIDKYDPDAAADNKEVAASKKLKRTHSRLSFHVGDE